MKTLSLNIFAMQASGGSFNSLETFRVGVRERCQLCNIIDFTWVIVWYKPAYVIQRCYRLRRANRQRSYLFNNVAYCCCRRISVFITMAWKTCLSISHTLHAVNATKIQTIKGLKHFKIAARWQTPNVRRLLLNTKYTYQTAWSWNRKRTFPVALLCTLRETISSITILCLVNVLDIVHTDRWTSMVFS